MTDKTKEALEAAQFVLDHYHPADGDSKEWCNWCSNEQAADCPVGIAAKLVREALSE